MLHNTIGSICHWLNSAIGAQVETMYCRLALRLLRLFALGTSAGTELQLFAGEAWGDGLTSSSLLLLTSTLTLAPILTRSTNPNPTYGYHITIDHHSSMCIVLQQHVPTAAKRTVFGEEVSHRAMQRGVMQILRFGVTKNNFTNDFLTPKHHLA